MKELAGGWSEQVLVWMVVAREAAETAEPENLADKNTLQEQRNSEANIAHMHIQREHR